jgi:histone-lysine N-methyltransferase SETMAR
MIHHFVTFPAFSKISRSLHEIVSDKLRFRKLCSRWVPKMLTDEHKMKQATWHAVMLHDNARPHTAATTQDLIATFGWEQFDHPPYSPDLATSDFHVFLHLKIFLGGRWFDDNEVKDAVNTWFATHAASFYDAEIQKLVPRYKCLNNGGSYVEK